MYTLSINDELSEEGRYLGVLEIANTANPAIKMTGIAFSNSTELLFKDELKYRIAAPILMPSIIFRRDPETGEEYDVKVTPEVVEAMFVRFMKDRVGGDVFNVEHDESKRVPSYILETWLVETPKTDKSFVTYGLECPTKTWFGVQQFTDVDAYNKAVELGQVGFSIHGDGVLQLSTHTKTDFSDVILLNNNNEVLMLLRTKDDLFEPNKYGFPGGKNENENNSLAAARELFEEAGIKPDLLLYLEDIKNEDGTVTSYYVGKSNIDPILSDEHNSFKWTSIDELGNIDVILHQNNRFIELANKAVDKLQLSNHKTEIQMKVQLKKHKHIARFTDAVETDENEIIVSADELVEGSEVVVIDENFEEIADFSGEVTIDDVPVVIENDVIKSMGVTEEVPVEAADEEVVVEEEVAMAEETEAPIEAVDTPTGETYTKEEVDAKFQELMDLIAEMKVEAPVAMAEEVEAPIKMSATQTRVQAQMAKLDAMGRAKQIMQNNKNK